MRISLDYETRSPCDLIKCGEWVYAEHPYTEIICCAVKVEDKRPFLWMPSWSYLLLPEEHGLNLITHQGMWDILDQATEIECHNVGFERAVWSWCATRKYGWSEPIPAKLRCSLAKCAYHALPRALGAACAALELPVQKDMEGHKLMMKMCKPRKPLKKERLELEAAGCTVRDDGGIVPAIGAMYYLWHEKPEDIVRLAEYCLQDVEAEHALSSALADLPAGELAVWQLDQEINARGIQADIKSAKVFIEEIGKFETKLLAETKILTNGMVASPKQIAASLKWLALQGVTMPDMTKNSVAEAAALTGLPSNVSRFLEIRKQLGRASTAKYQAIVKASSSDGRARGTQRYHGASTGRAAGKLVQPHNFPRGAFKDQDLCIDLANEGGFDDWFTVLYGDTMGAASTCLRGMLIAPPGHNLIASDFSAIEARVNAWLAGEQEVLDAFVAGLDPYRVDASVIFNVPYESIAKTDSKRQVGKAANLGLGFGGGIGAFATMAKNSGIDLETLPEHVLPLAPPEVLERAEKMATTFLKKNPGVMSHRAATACDVIKQLWRQKRPHIVALWAGLEEAAFKAVLEPGTTWKYRDIKYRADDQFLRCKLPSGRCLHYYKPGLQEKKTPWGQMKNVVTFWGIDSTTNKFISHHLYGGLSCENCVQATARDLMVESMLRVEERGFPVILTVHDELVSEIPQGFSSLKEYEDIMSETPAWAVGCPVSSEGWIGKRYRK